MKLHIARVLILAATTAAACNDVAGIAPPILDATVVPCESLADCESSAPVCQGAAACSDGFCDFADLPDLSCYDGLVGTEGVGQCKAGTTHCDPALGGYGMCVEQILPSLERCDDAGLDEDCDGQVNEGGEGCSCGDGIVSPEADEECEDGNLVDDDACSNTCITARCGDGVLQPGAGEECDDGGSVDGDACSPLCQKQEVLSLAAGTNHTCALLSGGEIKCWGKNEYGQLGLGDTLTRGDAPGQMGSALPLVDLGPAKRAVALTAGNCYTCALLSEGEVKCWGCNGLGQLGQGDSINRGDLPDQMGDALPVVDLGAGAKVKALASGFDHTCALLESGALKCWGRNSRGQLGLGDKGIRGNDMNEMGDNLPAVELGSGNAASALALGREHTCALLLSNRVKCWGKNDVGQLGLGDNADRGDEGGEMGDSLPLIELGGNPTVVSVGAGDHFGCAILQGGAVKCWGRNADGQLGQGDKDDRGDAGGEMGDALLPIELGGGKAAVEIVGGGSYACARLSDQTLKCWGDAGAGQLGLEDNVKRGDSPGQMGDALPPVSLGTGRSPAGVVASQVRTCAWLDDRSARCWGKNDVGQLGLGDTLQRGDDPGEMGDDLPRVRLFSDLW